MRKLLLASAPLLVGLAVVPRAQTPPPDAIVVNAKVVTVDQAFSIAQAVAIRDGRFAAVGTNEAIRKLAGPSTRVIDAAGRTVIPGLEDDHFHDAGGGPGVDLSRARSLDDVLAAVAARVKASHPGDVIVSNSDWHEAQLREQRLPLRADLDRISPANPVVLVRGGHEYILNSAALAKWHIDRRTKDPDGGRITRDAHGEPNGELVDRAKTLVELPPPPKLSIDYLATQHKVLNAAGLTSIRYAGASIEQLRMLQEMERQGVLTIRVNQLMRAAGTDDPARVRGIIEGWHIRPDEGDEWVRVGGMKFVVDGGFEGGWMREPYEEPYGQHGTYRGLQVIPADRYTAVVREVNRMGWRVGTHAVGDAAIDQVLAAYEAANADRSIVGRRWSIEHGFIPREDQFPRMKQLDLVISAQDHLYLAGPSLVKYWGLARAASTTPVRTYLDRGFMVAGGTDSAVVPYPPLWVIYHFVTRKTISGMTLGADQRISRQEALRLETINNAYLTFEEKTKGSIEPGKLADLVVLDRDILTCPDGDIEKMSVLLTMVGGRVVYSRPPLPTATAP